MILDVRTSFVTRKGQSYVPVNYDHLEHGPVLARTALASSNNIPAVITLQHVGLARLFTLLGRLGVTTLSLADLNEFHGRMQAPGGGGGCGCDLAARRGGAGDLAGALMVLGLAGVVVARRRRTGTRASGAGLA